MNDSNVLEKMKIAHQFLDHYRNSGIALSVSLAAYSGSETWWLHDQFIRLGDNFSCTSWLAIISAVLLFVGSFLFQFIHYLGAMWRARFVAGYKKHDSFAEDGRWMYKKSISYHYWADGILYALMGIAVFNAIFLICFVAQTLPKK